MNGPTFTESLAVRLLARDGIAAIWQLHVAAAAAYRDGYQRAPKPCCRSRMQQSASCSAAAAPLKTGR